MQRAYNIILIHVAKHLRKNSNSGPRILKNGSCNIPRNIAQREKLVRLSCLRQYWGARCAINRNLKYFFKNRHLVDTHIASV